MTTKPKVPKLNDVNRIVINRISVWKMDNPTRWCKVAGGPGFVTKSNINRDKTPEQMRSFVAKKLSLTYKKKVFENENTKVFEDRNLYRYWISENTLNIAMRNM
jgi:hypothetical protein